MPQSLGGVTVGVDTHGKIHVGAVADQLGRILGTIEITTDERGFRQLENYAKSFRTIERFGVEGTGAYGATLCRWLTHRGHERASEPQIGVAQERDCRARGQE